MILVDTSVWVDHLRRGDQALAAALEAGQVLTHPFIVGELACGNLQHRAEVLALLRALPGAPVATHDEALRFICYNSKTP
jgi:predicted nucleic acid-binding protein